MRSDKNNITIRYAQPDDREGLYRLWQACFHDSDSFTDYYFDYYFRENKVLMLENEDGLQAMLHLNSYRIMIEGKTVDTYYIVGVATEERYRHRKAMTRLLQKVFLDTWNAGIPFVYLMPADEAIYRPFQFAYIYAQQVEDFQWQTELQGGDQAVSAAAVGDILCRPLSSETDRKLLADRVNELLRNKYDIFTLRDARYYERLQMENRADGGELLLLYVQGKPAGFLSYACEETVEVREIFCRPEWHGQILGWMRDYFAGKKGQVLPLMHGGFLKGKGQEDHSVTSFLRPVIMGRIIRLRQWMQLLKTDHSSFSLCLAIRDDWIGENDGVWLWQAVDGKTVFERTERQPDLGMSIDSLMQWTTGYCSVTELEASGEICFMTDCRGILKEIPVFEKILINEIV